MKHAYRGFLTGMHRREIYDVFERLVTSLRTDDARGIAALCSASSTADTSVTGHFVGPSAMAAGLAWPGPPTSRSRASILNFVARSHGERAVQTAYVQCARAVTADQQIYPFLYGFQFSNELVRGPDGWKFSSIRAELCYESGNNDFVRGRWRLMNYDAYAGQHPVINAELDNPWLVIPVDDEPQSDAEEIFELAYKYAYAFDNGDFAFLASFTTPDFFINGSSPERRAFNGPRPGDYAGGRDVNNFLKDKFHKEAKMMHSFRMGSLDATGSTATATLYRGEDHRLRGVSLDRTNLGSVFTTALHTLDARKHDDGWRMSRYRVQPTQVTATPVPDSCMTYSEYLRDTAGERR